MIARQKRAKTLQLVAVCSALPPYASCKDEASLKADGTNANTGHHSWESNPASLLSPFCLCCFNFTPAKSPWITSLSSALTYIPRASLTHSHLSSCACVSMWRKVWVCRCICVVLPPKTLCIAKTFLPCPLFNSLASKSQWSTKHLSFTAYLCQQATGTTSSNSISYTPSAFL